MGKQLVHKIELDFSVTANERESGYLQETQAGTDQLSPSVAIQVNGLHSHQLTSIKL